LGYHLNLNIEFVDSEEKIATLKFDSFADDGDYEVFFFITISFILILKKPPHIKSLSKIASNRLRNKLSRDCKQYSNQIDYPFVVINFFFSLIIYVLLLEIPIITEIID